MTRVIKVIRFADIKLLKIFSFIRDARLARIIGVLRVTHHTCVYQLVCAYGGAVGLSVRLRLDGAEAVV